MLGDHVQSHTVPLSFLLLNYLDLLDWKHIQYIKTRRLVNLKSAKPYTNCQQMDGQDVIMDQQSYTVLTNVIA